MKISNWTQARPPITEPDPPEFALTWGDVLAGVGFLLALIIGSVAAVAATFFALSCLYQLLRPIIFG